MQISELHLLTKLDLARDYVWQGGRRPPTAVEEAADAWFLAFGASHAMRQMIVILRDASRNLWLLRAWREAQPDAYGRPLNSLAIGRLDLAGQAIGHALIAALLSRQPSLTEFESGGSCSLATPVDEQHADDDAVAHAAALRILTDASHPFVQNAASLNALVQRLGEDAFDWFAAGDEFTRDRLPAGYGVVLTFDPEKPTSIPSELLPLFKDASLSFQTLLAAAPEPARRAKLLRLLAGSDVPDLAPLSDEELSWLLPNQAARQQTLHAATPAQLARLAQAQQLTADDAPIVAKKLAGAPRTLAPDFAPFFAAIDQHETFIRIFGVAAPGCEAFLSADALTLWKHLVDPAANPRPEYGLEEAITRIESLSMFKTLSINALLRAYWVPGVKGKLIARLAEDFGQPIAESLLDGSDPGPVDTKAPESLPDAKFIASLNPAFIAALGARLAFGKWTDWWHTLAGSHPSIGPGPLDTPDAPWSIARGWAIASATRSGTLNAETFVHTALRWLDEAAPGTAESLPAIWTAAGCTGEALLALIHRADQSLIEKVCARLSWFAQHKLADTAAIFAAMPQPSFAAIAHGAGADANFVALVNLTPGAIGPLAAPSEVPEALKSWLPLLVPQAAFWSRWQDGIPIEVLGWIETQLGEHPTRQLAAAVRSAAAGESTLLPGQIPLLSSALSAPAICRQLVSLASGGDRSSAEALLSSRAMLQRPELAAWLRRRLFHWFLPTEQPPPFSVAELTAIAPLLDLRELAAAVSELGGAPALDTVIQKHPRYALVPALSELPASLTSHFIQP